MANKVVALDAGHGLHTSGKQTPDGIKEWTLNDKVRDKVVAMLQGYNVSFIFPDNNEGYTDESLTSRRTMYVNKKVDAAVSIHHNAYKGTWCAATGVEVYVDKAGTTKDNALANAIYPRLVANTGLKGRGVKKANWTVINQNTVPAVLVEGGFMDNKKDHAVITSDTGQTAYAKAIAEGLIEFLGLKKVSSKPSTSTSSTSSGTPFKVKFKEEMNVRKNAGPKCEQVIQNGKPLVCKKGTIYTIVETTKVGTALWGKLKSGAGWVCIAAKYCDRV
jgi:N-acetylmuramoyl-L-alanine amidase